MPRSDAVRPAGCRIGAPNSLPRTVSVVALDPSSAELVARLSAQVWGRARFHPAGAFGAGRDLIGEIEGADFVVLVTTVGQRVPVVDLVGDWCRLRGVALTVVVVQGPDSTDSDLATATARLRPWASMLVCTHSGDYVDDMLHALRA